MRKFVRKCYGYLLALLVPAAIVLAAFASKGIYPFGDTSVFVWDMSIQYAGFFGWLSDLLRNGGNIGYSFSKGLGGNMIALFAYYLSSPFNVLAAFFDPAQTPQMLSLITVLKVAFAGLTCYVFLRARYGASRGFVLASTAYATCSYVLGYCSNIMWLDGVIMLPLVALGVQRCVQRKAYGVLFLSVTASIFFNWYTAYMACLFSALFFVFEVLASKQFAPKGHLRDLAFATGRYICCMLLALGASLVLFLPAIIALAQGKGGGFDLALFLDPAFPVNPLDLFSYFIIGSSVGSEISAPPLFVSGMVVVCVGAYFFDAGVARRRRVAYGVLLVILAASFCYFTFADVWTGFIRSSSYNHRQTFVFIFVLVMIAAEELVRFKAARDDDKRVPAAIVPGPLARIVHRIGGRLLVSALLLDALILASAFNVWFRTSEVQPSAVLLLAQLVFLPLFALIIGCVFSSTLCFVARRCALAVLVVAFICEQGGNAVTLFGKYSQSVSSYESYMTSMEAAYGKLLEGKTFPRVGQATFDYLGRDSWATTDESLALGVSGLNHYSSTMRETSELVSSRLGYCKSSIFGMYYNSPLLVPDSLLGVRYILSTHAPASAVPLEGIKLPYEGIKAYESTRALPIGYGVAPGAGQGVGWSDNPFENQEAMLASMAGEDAKGLYVHEDAVAAQPVGANTPYQQGLHWNVQVSHSGPVYVYTPLINTSVPNDGGITSNVYVNGKLIQVVGGRFSANVVYAGEYHQGDELDVKLMPVFKDQKIPDDHGNIITANQVYGQSDDPDFLIVQTLDLDEYDRLVGKLDTQGFVIDRATDGSLDATFQAARDERLFLSIPYSDGWQASVNGKPAQVHCLFDGLMGLDVGAGTNVITLRFTPPGLYAGGALSAASVAVAVAIALVRRRRKRALALGSDVSTARNA